MKDVFINMPLEVKGFLALLGGTIMHALSETSLMQVISILLAFFGLIVQVSIYFKNKAEEAKSLAEKAVAEEEIKIKKEENLREAELHEAQMHILHEKSKKGRH